MNRVERRAAERRGITAQDLRQEGLRATREAVRAYSVAVAMVLYDKLGEDKETLHQTLRQISDLFDGINKGYLTIADMEITLRDEADVVFE